MTFKLRQQIDLDELYPREYFEFERRSGSEMQVIACKIRGVRNPALRSEARLIAQMHLKTKPAHFRSEQPAKWYNFSKKILFKFLQLNY